MELRGKKIAIFMETACQEMEVWYPDFRFQEAGAESVFAGAKPGKAYSSKLGCPAIAQLSYDAVHADQFGGVVIPVRYAPGHTRRHRADNEFVRDMDAQDKLAASICHGAWILCSAGILKGRCASIKVLVETPVLAA